ncbi:MAG: hypothetical protein A2X18_12220 [Bacteroidetes bacterium GWF2_40_14]|nr:MAG: hypothetical protein A2X18_12220 [Bacteroidetes bacterium GWF2_40_14]
MKTSASKKIFFLSFCIFVLSSCLKLSPNNQEDPKVYFDFATTGNYSFSLDYKTSFNSPIVFYIYDEYPFVPVANDPDREVFKTGLNPILKGITENFGKYTGIVNIKKTVNQLYVYSTTLGVPQLLKSSFANNKFTVDASSTASYITAAVDVKSSEMITLNGSIPGYTTLGTWNSSGRPNYLMSPNATISAGLINVVNSSLPEGTRVPERNPQFITNGASSALRIIEDATVEVVFIHEGADYRNALGYFHYPTSSPPSSISSISRIIAFPNVSYSGSGGGLASGNRVQLQYWNGTTLTNVFPAGTSIGWFIAANGWNSNGTINQSAQHYYSLEQFNPETNSLLRPHNVLLYDPQRQLVVLGFEDLNRAFGSDDDFNDAVFYAVGTPVTAIDYDDLPVVVDPTDTDGDGIPNDRDEFPNDPDVVYSTHYPSLNTYHSVAYEDLWPSRGDYDMNDVVVSYNSTHFLNGANKIVKITDRIKPLWSGGILDVGFGYQMGVSSSSVSSVNKTSTFTDNSFRYQLSANGTEQSQSKATIMVFDNVTTLGLTGTGAKPVFNIDIRFTSPVTIDQVTTPPYNPFIVVNNNSRGREVHLPNYLPTELADSRQLGSANDKSDPSQNRYYVSDDAMPFAILIPENFEWPTESVNIGVYYPKFLQWAKSLGVDYPDWYLYPR